MSTWSSLTPILTNRILDILNAYLRLFWGIVKVLGFGTACHVAYNSVSESYLAGIAGWHTVSQFIILLYLFPAYLYFNFSGYCDVVIAGASLLGISMPENFEVPIPFEKSRRPVDAVAP